MRSIQRSLPVLLFASLALALLIGLLHGPSLMAEGSAAGAIDQPLILSGQSPSVQDFIPPGHANFTVTITNTGTVTLQNVNVTGATTADCNRSDLGTLSPGQTTSYVCTTSGGAPVTESFLNELQVNGTAGVTTVSHTSNAYVKVINQDLRITKTPRFQSVQMGGMAFFNITVLNTSDFVMTLEQIDDGVFGECDRDPSATIALLPGEPFKINCSPNDIQTATASEITVIAKNADNPDSEPLIATDIAWVDVLSLEATLNPSPASIPEPGGLVTYTVEIFNTGSLSLTLTELRTTKFGNLLDPDNPLIESGTNACLSGGTPPLIPPNGGGYSCAYVAPVSGQPSQFTDTLTVTAVDKNSETVSTTAPAAVTITNVPSAIQLTLGATPSFINPPSQEVTFSVQIKNASSADSITITKIEDSILGNLDGRGTCDVPVAGVLPGFSYQCQFTAVVSGDVGDQRSRTISVEARDDDPVPAILNASDIVIVTFIEQPEQKIFMPSVADDNDPVIEPNNSCATAHNMFLNRQYFVLPPAVYPSDQDYFMFDLVQAGPVSIDLKNFVPQKGQMVVRYDDSTKPLPNCAKVQKRMSELALNNTMNLNLSAGRYYIQIINDGSSNITEMYELIVHVSAP